MIINKKNSGTSDAQLLMKANGLLPKGAELVSVSLSEERRQYAKNSYYDLIVVYRYNGQLQRTRVSSQPSRRTK